MSGGAREGDPGGLGVTALVVDDIGLLVAERSSARDRKLGIIHDAALVIEDGEVVAVEQQHDSDERDRRRGAASSPGSSTAVRISSSPVIAPTSSPRACQGRPYEAGGIR